MRINRLFLFLFSLLFLQLNSYAQSKTDVVLIGEYHYYYGNNKIKTNLIDSIIACNRNDSFVIALEFPITLEYLISIGDSVGIQKYFKYNTDNKLHKTTYSRMNQISLNFITLILQYAQYYNTSIRCIDTYYTNRSIIFTIHRMMEKYPIFHDSFYRQISEVLQKPKIELDAVWVIDTLRSRITRNQYQYEKQLDSIDFVFLNKIVNTPLFTFENVFGTSRDEYMYNQLERVRIEYRNSTIICFLGNAHVRKSKSNVYSLLIGDDKYSVFNIGIIPQDVSKKSMSLKFDRIIINKGANIFSSP